MLRRQRSLYRRFLQTGGVLWANPGPLHDVRRIEGAAEMIKPEGMDWPGYMVLTDDQVAWAVESGDDFSQGIVSLLSITALRRDARRLTIWYLDGNPRQPVTFRGLLGDLMASTADDLHDVSLDFPTSRAAEQAERRIRRQQGIARERWPALATARETDQA